MLTFETKDKLARLDHLDLLRGIAAFLVLAGHVRAFIFQSYGELAHASVSEKAFYFATGLGHQAVIIFFALSGFLVGGKAFDDMFKHRFLWSRYLMRRLTRLWIVIIPALFMTLVLDSIGAWLTLGRGYDGRYYDIYLSGPSAPDGIDHSLVTFFGNLFFMQTIQVPPFGSNGPMWSLANEFWYYIIFPLAAWLIIFRSINIGRLIGLVILIVAIMILPFWLLASGVVWLAGAAAAWCTGRQTLDGALTNWVTRLGAVTIFCGALVLSRVVGDNMGDLELGCIVAAVLPVLAKMPSPTGMYRTVARGLSEVSYTLYLTHFPLLTFVVLTGIAPNRLPPTVTAGALYAALIFTAIIWAVVLWWCFERHTDRVYSLLSGALRTTAIARCKMSKKS